jgi:hypothetical protein
MDLSPLFFYQTSAAKLRPITSCGQQTVFHERLAMNSRTSRILLQKGCILLLTGWAIYSFQRAGYYPLIPQLHPGTEFLRFLPAFVKDNLPSLLHVWAMVLLTAAVMPSLSFRFKVLVPAFWLMVNLLFELGQAFDKDSWILPRLPSMLAHYFIQGRFDKMDVLASCIGFLLALRTIACAAPEARSWDSFPLSRLKQHGFAALMTSFGLFSLMATSSQHPRERYISEPFPHPSQPIYMPYEEFRKSFAVLPAQPIAMPGRIYVKDDLLLVNDINQGIHIIHNADPSAPKPLNFLKILGSRDIAVFEHFLYVDSFVDFLVIDIADPQNPKLLQRLEDIFPWQPELWFPQSSSVVSYADPRKGVIIGFEENSSPSSQEN